MADKTPVAEEFLPTEYEVPTKPGNYMKFIDGKNLFRILASPVLGYGYWKTLGDGTKKPVRVSMNVKINMEDVEDPDDIKHFWTMPVYNYTDKRVQILELTQKKIQETLRSLAKDPAWGSPLNYDVVISKTGQLLKTRYEDLPQPPKPVDPEFVKQYQDMRIDLQEWMIGNDPFMAAREAREAADK